MMAKASICLMLALVWAGGGAGDRNTVVTDAKAAQLRHLGADQVCRAFRSHIAAAAQLAIRRGR